MDNAYALPVDEVLGSFAVDAAAGLTDTQVADLRQKHGKNGMRPTLLLDRASAAASERQAADSQPPPR